MVEKQRNRKKSVQGGFALVGKTEYHDLTTNNESSTEQIVILRDDGVLHVLSLNRMAIDVLIHECQMPGSGFISNYKKQKKGKHVAKGAIRGQQQQRQARVKAIHTTTQTVCPDCSAELEVSLSLEVEDPKQQRCSNNNWNDKSATMLHYLQCQTKKQEKWIQALTRERDNLRANNQMLKDAPKEAFQVLDNYAKKKNTEVSQLKKELQKQQAKAEEEETSNSAAQEQVIAQLKTSAVELKKELAQAKVDSQKELEVAHAASTNWRQQFLQQEKETAVVYDMLEKLREKYRALSRQLREICPTPSFKL